MLLKTAKFINWFILICYDGGIVFGVGIENVPPDSWLYIVLWNIYFVFMLLVLYQKTMPKQEHDKTEELQKK